MEDGNSKPLTLAEIKAQGGVMFVAMNNIDVMFQEALQKVDEFNSVCAKLLDNDKKETK